MALAFHGAMVAFLIAWSITTVFGLAVLVLRWAHPPSRALGVAIGGTAPVGVAFGLGQLEQDPVMASFWLEQVAPFFSILRPFLWIYFILSFPRPRWFAKKRGGLWVVFAPMLAIETAYVMDTSWMTPNLHWLLVMLGYLAGSVMAVVMFNHFLREPAGPLRESLFLISIGWLPGTSLVGAYHAVTRFSFEPLVYAAAGVGVLMVYAYAYLAWRFVRHERVTGRPFEPWRRALFFGFPLTALAGSTVATVIFFARGPSAGMSASELVDAIWCAGGVLLLIYGILKYQMLGIDYRLKWTIKRSTMAAAFVAAFFVASEGAQILFAEQARLGPWVGLAAAGLLVFAVAPLQRVGERVADAAMPGVKPIAQMNQDERHAIYLDQARFAWSDGALSVKDRQILEVARKGLRLSLEEARALEEDALRASGPASASLAA